MRVILQRERRRPGVQLSLFERHDEWWHYQAPVTNTKVGQLAFLEARHRAHAWTNRPEPHAKDSGLGGFPFREFSSNQTWPMLTQTRPT